MEKQNNTKEHNRVPTQGISGQELKSQRTVRRPRSLTTLRLEVVAERARKLKRIKEALAINSYKIDSNLLAKSLLENFNEDDLD